MKIIELILLGMLGWACGAMVNYLAEILPLRRRLVKPLCMKCQETIPLLDYLFWPRKCVQCHHSRSRWAWVVELVYVGLVVWLAHTAPPKLGIWGSLPLLVLFGVIVVIDIRYRVILHPVSIAGAILGFTVGCYLHGVLDSLAGGAFGFGVMLAFYKLGELFLKVMARRRGENVEDVALGFGDVNLSGVLGLILGFPGIVVGLFLGILIGGVVSLVFLLVNLLLRRYKPFDALPYGPSLVAGAVLMLFFPGLLALLLAP